MLTLDSVGEGVTTLCQSCHGIRLRFHEDVFPSFFFLVKWSTPGVCENSASSTGAYLKSNLQETIVVVRSEDKGFPKPKEWRTFRSEPVIQEKHVSYELEKFEIVKYERNQSDDPNF